MGQVSKSDGDGRPRVVVSIGMSVDGRIALRRGQLWNDEDPTRVESQPRPSSRALHDARSSLIEELYHPQAVLEGSNSLVRDSAGPLTGLPTDFDEPVEVLYTDFLPAEVVERPEHEKWFTIVDSRGRVEWDLDRDDSGWDTLSLVARATPAEYLAYLRKIRRCYLVVGEERVDLALALRRMRERLGVTSVRSSAGGGVNGALLRAGLIDEIHLLVSPSVVGGLDTPSLFDGPPLAEGESPTQLRLLFVHAETDGMLWLRYEVVHEETPVSRA
jgi:2,5-diamino-6-(ribosylamino)-4(3H)-pyrimidinone 5'-phosphate reductase